MQTDTCNSLLHSWVDAQPGPTILAPQNPVTDIARHDTGGHLGQLQRGCWDYYQEFGKHSAAIACPTGDHLFSLVNHTIDAAGNVSPSVVCPRPPCSFHEFVRLVDWRAW